MNLFQLLFRAEAAHHGHSNRIRFRGVRSGESRLVFALQGIAEDIVLSTLPHGTMGRVLNFPIRPLGLETQKLEGGLP